jgi:enolase
MPVITLLSAIEILDSRGKPTVKATCTLADGATASASVPSGASTGAAEAHELRDGDPKRYRGQGCRKAVANVNGEIAAALRGWEIADQGQLDQALIALDGTANKSRLGANAILAVSIAFARAVSVERGLALYEHFSRMIGRVPVTLPRMTINLFSGGRHAGGQMPIQDVLIVPLGTIDQGLVNAYAVYQAAAELTREKYGTRALTADEGGLAPPFPSVEAALDDAVESIVGAGLSPVDDVRLAIDVASTQFYRDGRYVLGGETLTSDEMVAQVDQWARAYPIVSVEDGLSEDDWSHWPRLRERIGGGDRLVLGDDLLCTNPARIRRAVKTKAVDALLLKVNQIGTLTEAAEALALAREAGWRVTISARSGETEDSWLADLAVGWAGDQIKVGSITQSERLAKYNRLLEIEAESALRMVDWPRPA